MRMSRYYKPSSAEEGWIVVATLSLFVALYVVCKNLPKPPSQFQQRLEKVRTDFDRQVNAAKSKTQTQNSPKSVFADGEQINASTTGAAASGALLPLPSATRFKVIQQLDSSGCIQHFDYHLKFAATTDGGYCLSGRGIRLQDDENTTPASIITDGFVSITGDDTWWLESFFIHRLGQPVKLRVLTTGKWDWNTGTLLEGQFHGWGLHEVYPQTAMVHRKGHYTTFEAKKHGNGEIV